jgi:hypothetical protein
MKDQPREKNAQGQRSPKNENKMRLLYKKIKNIVERKQKKTLKKN